MEMTNVRLSRLPFIARYRPPQLHLVRHRSTNGNYRSQSHARRYQLLSSSSSAPADATATGDVTVAVLHSRHGPGDPGGGVATRRAPTSDPTWPVPGL